MAITPDKKELPTGAILQRDGETYAIVPKTPVGLLTADTLESIAATVRKFDIPIIKITSGQRFALVGIKEDQVDAVWDDLGIPPGAARRQALCLHYVQACPGTEVCRFGVQDSIAMGQALDSIFDGEPFPAKVKIGVSGCTFCCGESFVRDIGVMGKKNGWTVVVGGIAARKPRIGDIIGENLSTEEALELIHKFAHYYRENSEGKERIARFVNRIGVDKMKDEVAEL